MNKNVTLAAIVGFLCFLALMCGGFYWFFNVIHVQFAFLNTIKWICSIVLTVVGVIMGWIWISGTKMNKTLKIILMFLFIVFAVLAIMGYIGFGF